jgi:aminobenzoyl-glutamate utilization protein B
MFAGDLARIICTKNPIPGEVFSTMMGFSRSFSIRGSGFVSLVCCLLCGCAQRMQAQSVSAHNQLEKLVDDNSANWKQVSKQIWDFAELGYHEEKSSSLLRSQLKAAGFTVESGVAGEPTGFIASYGHGKPMIALLGEFDALPGLSQQTVPERAPVTQGGSGHACGHNLLGSGAALAAVAVKQYIEANHIGGTLRY